MHNLNEFLYSQNAPEVRGCVQLFVGNPSQSYWASPAIWDQRMLHATQHRWMHPTLTPAKQASTRYTYLRGMEG